MINKANEYIFTSERIGYRLLKKNDFNDYFKLDSDPEIREFFPQNKALDEKTIKANMQKNIAFFKANDFGVFIAIELASGEFIGRCGFGKIATGEIEVGYVFLQKFWGKGLASEALLSLLNWAKSNIFVVDSIIAFTPTAHLASQRVMQKAGMQFYKEERKEGIEYVFYKINLR